jgi:hypothetical protein
LPHAVRERLEEDTLGESSPRKHDCGSSRLAVPDGKRLRPLLIGSGRLDSWREPGCKNSVFECSSLNGVEQERSDAIVEQRRRSILEIVGSDQGPDECGGARFILIQ